MKKTIITLLVFFIIGNVDISAQNRSNEYLADKIYHEVIDNWVMFPKDNTSYFYGFVYLDETAGFTLHIEGEFKIDGNGLFVENKPLKNSIMKLRLSSESRLFAVMPKEKIKELNLPDEPDWLEIYRMDKNTIQYLYSLGYAFNAAGESTLALDPLLAAYSKEPDYKGLVFELAYAFNATGEYEKATSVLERAIKNDPKNFYLYRELGYTLCGLQRLEEAERVYQESLLLTDDNGQRSEVGINMVQAYYYADDKEKFEKWYKYTKQYADPKSEIYKYLELYKAEMDKR